MTKTASQKWFFIAFFSFLILFGAIPHYRKGQWQIVAPKYIKNLSQIQKIKEKGLPLEDINSPQKEQIEINDQKWLKQTILLDNQLSVNLLLFPQNGQKQFPEVEWLNLKQHYQWQISKAENVTLTINSSQDIQARFFQATTSKETFAVLQWYAWHNGGSPLIEDWFWSDQLAQYQKKRLPWVAVTLIAPIDSLSDIKDIKPQLESLGIKVQKSLNNRLKFKP